MQYHRNISFAIVTYLYCFIKSIVPILIIKVAIEPPIIVSIYALFCIELIKYFIRAQSPICKRQ